MARLLESHGATDERKVAALYGICTGLGVEAGWAMLREMTA